MSVSYETGTIKLKGEPIEVHWEVWFLTPFGLVVDLRDAVQRCIKVDMNPEQCIFPIPVAVAASGEYEAVYPVRPMTH